MRVLVGTIEYTIELNTFKGPLLLYTRDTHSSVSALDERNVAYVTFHCFFFSYSYTLCPCMFSSTSFCFELI